MNVKFDDIWAILNQYNFKFEESLTIDISCVICKNILIDAKQAPCACKFCFKCISDYLINLETFCPGGKEECQEELLKLDNVVTDYSSNRKVLKLIVKCPSENCSFMSELINIEAHLRVCKGTPTTCPYSQVGCGEKCLDRNLMNVHLEIHIFDHIKLLMDTIENLKNEMKVNYLKYDNEIELLKKENDALKVLCRKNQAYHSDMNNKIDKLTTSHDNFEFACGKVVKDNVDLRKIIDENKEMMNNMNVKIATLSNQNENQGQIPEKRIETIEKVIMEIRKKIGEIVWIVDVNLENEGGVNLYSEPFFTHPNGYKLQLVLRPGGCMDISGFGVSISLRMSVGHNDVNLRWPVTCSITVGVIDQDVDIIHKSDNRIMEFHETPSDLSSTFKFRRADLSGGVLKNGRLAIYCSVAVTEN